MDEFYKDHTNDPDTNGKIILDPFMGGGTTIVEALRLGSKVIGVDLNPVAWFIVKTEIEPVDIDELKASFERLSNRVVKWSGKPLKETILDLYKTECPSCGSEDADIIYTFWVKSAFCTTGTCNHLTPLFSDYKIAQKNPSIRFYEDCECPDCKKIFDWEIEPAAHIGDKSLMINATQFSAGVGRASARWTYGPEKSKVDCPWCNDNITPIVKHNKKKRKKVPLNILYCASCEEVWQYRGELKEDSIVECPTCKLNYNPNEGNLHSRGKFICRGNCNGNVDAIINSIKKLPQNELLPIRPYAIQGYCQHCSSNNVYKVEENFFNMDECSENDRRSKNVPFSIIRKNKGKFFKRFSSQDLAKYQTAKDTWEKEKVNLQYPKSEVPIGEKTKSGLIAHHYKYWHQMFNERQLLSLSTLLNEIDNEKDHVLKEMLITTFSTSLDSNCTFTYLPPKRGSLARMFTMHAFKPQNSFIENNLWGFKNQGYTFPTFWNMLIEGKKYSKSPIDYYSTENGKRGLPRLSNENIEIYSKSNTTILNRSSQDLQEVIQAKVDYVITDPPYAGNVNYSELADFFYVWLRLILKRKYSEFSPEITPKIEEVIENKARGKSLEDFKQGLKEVFTECFRVSKDSAPLIFTFHHSEYSAWEALLDAVCDAGYFIEAVYPIHGEAENSPHLQNNEAISYDLIHVCKKRENTKILTKRSWAGIRQEIKQRAKEEIKLIESGRYGNETLPAPDVTILLIGKCLELYSKHYANVVDYNDQLVPINEALEDIKMMVDQLLTKDNPLPSELEDIDVPSYIYLTALCANKEITVDSVSKIVRGIIEPSILREYGIIVKGRGARGRTFEVKQPLERLNGLKERFRNGSHSSQQSLFSDTEIRLNKKVLFIDVLHLLLGLAESGDNLMPWLEKFGGLKPQIRAALEHLMSMNKNFISPAKKVLGLLDERTLFTKLENPQQGKG